MKVYGMDKESKMPVTISFEHHMVHDAKMYSASLYNTIGASANLDFFITTGDDEAHTNFDVATSGQAIIRLYEGVTVNANTVGTLVTPYNMYRSSSDSCASYCGYGTAFSTNSEVLLATILLPGGNVPSGKIGGQVKQSTEWVLKPNTRYMIRITDLAAATNTAAINLNFYEMD